ncbi:Uncharacterised protein [uncultured archaeon]|nr:Uncharacterised protein [uncultured archaeon]
MALKLAVVDGNGGIFPKSVSAEKADMIRAINADFGPDTKLILLDDNARALGGKRLQNAVDELLGILPPHNPDQQMLPGLGLEVRPEVRPDLPEIKRKFGISDEGHSPEGSSFWVRSTENLTSAFSKRYAMFFKHNEIPSISMINVSMLNREDALEKSLLTLGSLLLDGDIQHPDEAIRSLARQTMFSEPRERNKDKLDYVTRTSTLMTRALMMRLSYDEKALDNLEAPYPNRTPATEAEIKRALETEPPAAVYSKYILRAAIGHIAQPRHMTPPQTTLAEITAIANAFVDVEGAPSDAAKVRYELRRAIKGEQPQGVINGVLGIRLPQTFPEDEQLRLNL